MCWFSQSVGNSCSYYFHSVDSKENDDDCEEKGEAAQLKEKGNQYWKIS